MANDALALRVEELHPGWEVTRLAGGRWRASRPLGGSGSGSGESPREYVHADSPGTLNDRLADRDES